MFKINKTLLAILCISSSLSVGGSFGRNPLAKDAQMAVVDPEPLQEYLKLAYAEEDPNPMDYQEDLEGYAADLQCKVAYHESVLRSVDTDIFLEFNPNAEGFILGNSNVLMPKCSIDAIELVRIMARKHSSISDRLRYWRSPDKHMFIGKYDYLYFDLECATYLLLKSAIALYNHVINNPEADNLLEFIKAPIKAGLARKFKADLNNRHKGYFKVTDEQDLVFNRTSRFYSAPENQALLDILAGVIYNNVYTLALRDATAFARLEIAA